MRKEEFMLGEVGSPMTNERLNCVSGGAKRKKKSELLKLVVS
jgi:hypothetical protein